MDIPVLLPFSIQQPYLRLLQTETTEQETIVCIQKLIYKSVSCLARLAILEYAQAVRKDDFLSFSLFQCAGYTVSLREWIGLTRTVLNGMSDSNMLYVLPFLSQIRAKYASLQQENAEDRIGKLLWFYELAASDIPYVISSSDIQEIKDQILAFIEDFNVGKDVWYEWDNKNPTLVCEGKRLQLQPFFILKDNPELQRLLLDENAETGKSLQDAYKFWFANDYEKYREQKDGMLSFDAAVESLQKDYKPLPWLEVSLDAILEDFFQCLHNIKTQNILLVEGYPASGKTALAANLGKLVGGRLADFVFPYFLTPRHVSQNVDTVEKWISREFQKNNMNPNDIPADARILIVLDGIEYMEKKDYKKLLAHLEAPPFHKIGFVLCKRLYEPPDIDTPHKIVLNCGDNVYFEDSFRPDYVSSLLDRYIKSLPHGMDILKNLVENPDRLWTAVEIAEKIHAFSPQILKELKAMKPLLKTDYLEESGVTRYALFHPACKKLLQKQ